MSAFARKSVRAETTDRSQLQIRNFKLNYIHATISLQRLIVSQRAKAASPSMFNDVFVFLLPVGTNYSQGTEIHHSPKTKT